MAPQPRHLRIGVLAGLAFATLLSAWLLGMHALSGGLAVVGRDGAPLSPARVLAMCYGVGAVGGALSGWLLPLGQWRIGAAVVGVLACAVLYGGIEWARHGPVPWTGEDAGVIAITALCVGVPVGLTYRKMFRAPGVRGRRSRGAGRGESPGRPPAP
jgi:hypothetical protein